MSSATTNAGSFLSVSLTAPSTVDLAGYTTLYPTMNRVGKVTTMGEYDRVYEIIKRQYLDQRRDEKYKSSYDAGSMALSFDINPDDLGQEDLRTQRDVDANAFCAITHQDGTVDFFEALVTGASKVVSTSNDMYSSNCTLEINSDIIESPVIS